MGYNRYTKKGYDAAAKTFEPLDGTNVTGRSFMITGANSGIGMSNRHNHRHQLHIIILIMMMVALIHQKALNFSDAFFYPRAFPVSIYLTLTSVH